jgi:hypothetical protein
VVFAAASERGAETLKPAMCAAWPPGCLQKLNGGLDIKSATGYFQKCLRSGPNDDRRHLTRNMVGQGEEVDVLEETAPTDDKLGFARIRRRDGVSGWIHRCYLLATCREHDAQFQ